MLTHLGELFSPPTNCRRPHASQASFHHCSPPSTQLLAAPSQLFYLYHRRHSLPQPRPINIKPAVFWSRRCHALCLRHRCAHPSFIFFSQSDLANALLGRDGYIIVAITSAISSHSRPLNLTWHRPPPSFSPSISSTGCYKPLIPSSTTLRDSALPSPTCLRAHSMAHWKVICRQLSRRTESSITVHRCYHSHTHFSYVIINSASRSLLMWLGFAAL